MNRSKIPARDSGIGTVLFSFFAPRLKENPPIFFCLISLPGGNRPAKVTIEFFHRQAAHRTQSRFVLLYAKNEIEIVHLVQMGYRVIGFVPPVQSQYRRLNKFSLVDQRLERPLFIVRFSTVKFTFSHVAVDKNVIQHIVNKVCLSVIPAFGVSFRCVKII